MRDARSEARRALGHAVYAVGILADEAWGEGWREDGTGTPDRPKDLARLTKAIRALEKAQESVY